jgi:hypothetical protein
MKHNNEFNDPDLLPHQPSMTIEEARNRFSELGLTDQQLRKALNIKTKDDPNDAE